MAQLEFTEVDLLNYVEKNPRLKSKTRERKIIDPRNYIICILYYEFKWSEAKLGVYFNRHHSSINHCKWTPIDLRNDEIFIKNTQDVRHLFPYAFPTEIPLEFVKSRGEYKKLTRKHSITVQLNEAMYQKVKMYQRSNEITKINSAILRMISEY